MGKLGKSQDLCDFYNIPKWEYCKSIGFKPFSSIFPFKFIFKGILGKMENYLKAATSHITLTENFTLNSQLFTLNS